MQDTSISSIQARIRVIVLITAACLTLPGSAGENNPASSKKNMLPAQLPQQLGSLVGEVSENQEEPIEEITVVGQKLISNLRIQIIHAEDRAFALFNALNDDDEYDVHCRMEARTGTLIRKRMCLPNFYHDATAAEAQMHLGYIGVTNYYVVVPSASNVFALKYPMFKSKVKKLAAENPELYDAVRELFELNQELIKVRNAYHGINEK